MTFTKTTLFLIALATACGFLLGRNATVRSVTYNPPEASNPGAADSPEPIASTTKNSSASPAVSPPQNNTDNGSPLPAAAPGLTPATQSLAEALGRLKYVEMRRVCDQADVEWRKAKVDSRAPDSNAQDQKELLDSLKGILNRTSYFRGDSVIAGSPQIQFDVFLRLYNQHESAPGSNFPKVIDPADLCYAITPVFLADGKTSEQSMSMISTCGAGTKRMGDTFYLSWSTVGDKPTSDVMNVVLFPLPGSKNMSVHYMTSDREEWKTVEGFRWKDSTKAEHEQGQERYLKMREQTAAAH